MPSGVYERTKYPIEWVSEKNENVFVAGQQKLKLPPLQVLNWLFRYDEFTGKLYKIRESSGKVCKQEREITYLNSKGYIHVGITDSSGIVKNFRVHHICYFMHTGVEPLSIVDHINGIKTDNRFLNLRLVSDSINNRNKAMQRNNTSGITGVHWNKSIGKWQAYIRDNSGKQKTLGYYSDKEIAVKVISEYYSNPSNGYTDRHGL